MTWKWSSDPVAIHAVAGTNVGSAPAVVKMARASGSHSSASASIGAKARTRTPSSVCVGVFVPWSRTAAVTTAT